MSANVDEFTPALPLLWAYDFAVTSLTRESVWRKALLLQLDPQSSDVIADVGCGTGSFLMLAGKTAPSARLIGIDPDERVLERAERKLRSASVKADLYHGYIRDIGRLLANAGVNKIVSSLVFHHLSLPEKRDGLSAMFTALKAGGELHLADYGLQSNRLMRGLFRLVQRVDGYEQTQPNAEGILPQLMEQSGFHAVEEQLVFSTPTGMISLYRAVRAPR